MSCFILNTYTTLNTILSGIGLRCYSFSFLVLDPGRGCFRTISHIRAELQIPMFRMQWRQAETTSGGLEAANNTCSRSCRVIRTRESRFTAFAPEIVSWQDFI